MSEGQRFTEMPDGWWRDTKTGLEWSPTASDRMNHADASVWCEMAGGRLPTVNELVGIVDYERHSPATELFDTRSNFYWSASTYAPSYGLAWTILLSDGWVRVGPQPGLYYVRAVRDGS